MKAVAVGEKKTSFVLPAWTVSIGVVAGLVVLGFILTEFQLNVATEMLVLALFALSLNLIMGYGGMVHFGHAAFFGVGGYAVAIGIRRFGLDQLMAMAIAPFVSAFFALIIGWFCVRRVRLYFAILTLAFGQLMYTVAFQARNLTNGDDGIHGLPRPDFLATSQHYYLFTVVIFVVCYLALRVIVNSPFALTLRATRENSERAQFVGINVRRHQLMTFVIGAVFAGIAGALRVGEQQFVGIEMLFWTTSAEPILASLIGGMFSLPGPAIGGALLAFLNITLSSITSFWPIVLGTLTIIIVLVAPTGLVGLVQRFLNREVDES